MVIGCRTDLVEALVGLEDKLVEVAMWHSGGYVLVYIEALLK
jgi:hypothetical protein